MPALRRLRKLREMLQVRVFLKVEAILLPAIAIAADVHVLLTLAGSLAHT